VTAVTAILIVAALRNISGAVQPEVRQTIFDRGAERLTATTNQAPMAGDALRVAVCGSSAPLPSKDRAAPRITAIEVDHAPIAPAYAHRFDY
jgi:hypothetical protein